MKQPSTFPKGAATPSIDGMTRHLDIGKSGEDLAAAYLRSRGYTIVGRNVRVGPHDEIDILAHDPRDCVLVFAEVKTRTHADENFRPAMNADRRKRAALQRAAREWVTIHDYDGGYRIDLVSVAGNRIVEHIEELSWEH